MRLLMVDNNMFYCRSFHVFFPGVFDESCTSEICIYVNYCC